MQRRTAAAGKAKSAGGTASGEGTGTTIRQDFKSFSRPPKSSFFNTSTLVHAAVVVVFFALAYKLVARPPGTVGELSGTSQASDQLRSAFTASTPLFGHVQFTEHPDLGTCISLGGRLRHCANDEAALHECLIHPPILLHPFPRRVLIAGGSDGAHVREVLKHFLLKKVVVVGFDNHLADLCKEHLPDSYAFDDILSRAEFHAESLSDYLRSLPNEKFDILLVDLESGSKSSERISGGWLQLLKNHLSDGGIIGMRTGSLRRGNDIVWSAHSEFTRHFRHVHLYSAFVQSISQLVGFHVMYDTDGIPDPRNLAPHYVQLMCDRKTTEKLKYYDGYAHLNMFNLPPWLRGLAGKHTDEKAAGSWSRKPKSYAPHSEGRFNKLHDPVLRGSTVQREFFACHRDLLSDPKTLQEAVLEALKFAHASVLSVEAEDFDEYVNLTNHDPGLVRRLMVENANDSVDLDEEHSESSAVTEIIVNAMLSSGHVALHAFPHYRYVVATFVNFNFETVPGEFFGALFESLRAAHSVGSTLLVGPPMDPPTAMYPQTNPVVDHFQFPVAYYSAKSFRVQNSTTSGLGQYALEFIPKGTVLFSGPIDPHLIHDDELDVNRTPSWLSSYISHMSENAEHNVWVAAPSHDQDSSYFTNHNCDPNLVYDGYDTMKARHDIHPGEELTYDYATVDCDGDQEFPCSCGSPLCRKRITSDDWKDERLIERLGIGSFWPHIQKKIILSRREKIRVSASSADSWSEAHIRRKGETPEA